MTWQSHPARWVTAPSTMVSRIGAAPLAAAGLPHRGGQQFAQAGNVLAARQVIPGYERIIVLLQETGVPAGDLMAVLTAVENFILGSALDLAGPEVMWDIPPGVDAPCLAEAPAAQPAGAGRADRAFELGLDTMLSLMLRRAPG